MEELLKQILTGQDAIRHEIRHMKNEISAVRTVLKSEVTSVKTELKVDLATVKTEILEVKEAVHRIELSSLKI
ncbi:hypothetical protein V7138_10870 [Bacillus sp. JJ1533]|uniref:hypothetical protein n=1 Tax=Bacillus sp. JJ1533 TaxID=3122959 RepID=UPI002FFDB640